MRTPSEREVVARAIHGMRFGTFDSALCAADAAIAALDAHRREQAGDDGETVEAMVSAWRDYLTHHCHEDDDACAMRAALAVARQMDRSARDAGTCNWYEDGDDSDVWASSCGRVWQFNDGGPTENNMDYCHGCGKPIDAAMRGEAGDE